MLTELPRHGLTFGLADAPVRPRRHVDLRVPCWCAGSRPMQPRYISIAAQANARAGRGGGAAHRGRGPARTVRAASASAWPGVGDGRYGRKREAVMVAHADISGMLGAWALDGCSDTEAAAVRAHLAECPDCAAQARRLRSAAGWLGMDRVQPAPAGLRRSVLAAARARRPPAAWVTLTNAYADQVALLDAALAGMSPADWRRADSRHGDVRGVLGHLAGNDALLAAELGLPAVPMPAADDGPAMRAAWRAQADVMLAGVAEADPVRAVR